MVPYITEYLGYIIYFALNAMLIGRYPSAKPFLALMQPPDLKAKLLAELFAEPASAIEQRNPKRS